MKIFITTPDYSLHGGIRIILEWANRLCTFGHTVYLYSLKGGHCNWFHISDDVIQVNNHDLMKQSDCLIITSPHAVHLQNKTYPKRKFIFMQMCEHLFRPVDHHWRRQCMEFYTSPHHLIAISQWNIDLIKTQFKRKAVTHYVGNGVNFDHFPLSTEAKPGDTILVEGWESSNPSKDPEHIGPKVAARLKAAGLKILAYSGLPLKTMSRVPDEYYHRPSLSQLNDLYQRAGILVKASRYDARSCAPMEAMTKCTPTARAILQGDDDLVDGVNCYRTPYSEMILYTAALSLMKNDAARNMMAENCYNYVQQYSWDYWMPKINDILCNA